MVIMHPCNCVIVLSNFENCKFCQRVGLAPLTIAEKKLLCCEMPSDALRECHVFCSYIQLFFFFFF